MENGKGPKKTFHSTAMKFREYFWGLVGSEKEEEDAICKGIPHLPGSARNFKGPSS